MKQKYTKYTQTEERRKRESLCNSISLLFRTLSW